MDAPRVCAKQQEALVSHFYQQDDFLFLETIKLALIYTLLEPATSERLTKELPMFEKIALINILQILALSL